MLLDEYKEFGDVSRIGFGLLALACEPLSPNKYIFGFKFNCCSGKICIWPGLRPAPPANFIVEPGTELLPAVIKDKSLMSDVRVDLPFGNSFDCCRRQQISV